MMVLCTGVQVCRGMLELWWTTNDICMVVVATIRCCTLAATYTRYRALALYYHTVPALYAPLAMGGCVYYHRM